MIKKFIKNFLCILAGLMIISILLIDLILILNKIITPTFIQENNIINSECREHILKGIEEIAFNVSNHEYIRHKYDCTEFSKELVEQLKINNISAYCVFGIYKENSFQSLHTWIEINIDGNIYPIESTGGYFIDNETYSANYKALKKGFCL